MLIYYHHRNRSDCLAKEFDIKTLGRLKYFLGIEVTHSSEVIFISQRKYITDLLVETRKPTCKPANTPIDPNQKLCMADEEISIDRSKSHSAPSSKIRASFLCYYEEFSSLFQKVSVKTFKCDICELSKYTSLPFPLYLIFFQEFLLLQVKLFYQFICISFFVFLLLDLSVLQERFIRCQYKYWRTALRRKIHGKPPNYGKLHLANAQNENGVAPMIQGGASQDRSTSSQPSEIGKLREEIEQLRSMISSTSFAHANLPLQVFESVAYIHQSQNGLSKFAPRAIKAVFVGYSNTQKGYKFYDPRHQKFIVTINVTFDESKKHDLHIEILKENEVPKMLPINFSAPPPPPNRFGRGYYQRKPKIIKDTHE
ncbi:unnamed protein product [Spirodela intermedia]|uniref:Retroviral polymerase SH3-like domain-containing protein n=1 Tax=Spirodela intermedia TaxID=51605 RepID=A0A7I8IUF0_SPIIN|nr:unnamed protein product [Spirodela intermedia]CAA6661654.1 unnamed protein product [Spirodela intermedia]